MAKKKKKTAGNVIADNRKARHDFHLETFFEAGLQLQGWEVKSLREGRAQLKESYVVIKQGEAFLFGAHLSVPAYIPPHIPTDPTRTRKLLLHAKEIAKLREAKERDGYTIVPLNLHWTRNRAKCDIAIAKGKKEHDKRQTVKQREWEREKGRLVKKIS